MKCPHIIQAKLADEHTLMIQFSNQEIKQYSFQQLFTKQMFAPLQQPAFFRNFKIEPGGYALVWNEEIDISEYELWKNGTAVASKQILTTSIPESDEALD